MYSEQEEQIEETSSFRKVHASNQSGAQQLSIDRWLLYCNWLLIKKNKKTNRKQLLAVFLYLFSLNKWLPCFHVSPSVHMRRLFSSSGRHTEPSPLWPTQ